MRRTSQSDSSRRPLSLSAGLTLGRVPKGFLEDPPRSPAQTQLGLAALPLSQRPRASQGGPGIVGVLRGCWDQVTAQKDRDPPPRSQDDAGSQLTVTVPPKLWPANRGEAARSGLLCLCPGAAEPVLPAGVQTQK